jgi:hypothetical protein
MKPVPFIHEECCSSGAGPAATVPADTIRLARADDGPAIASLLAFSYVAPPRDFTGRGELRGCRAALPAEVSRSIREGTCYVAECDGRLIGACAWGRSGGSASACGAAHVWALAVDPAHPPLAVSRLLLVLCESAAARHGFEALRAAVPLQWAWLFVACSFCSPGPLPVGRPQEMCDPCLTLEKPLRPLRPLLAGRMRAPTPGAYESFTARL